ncbi:MAG: PAS domain-containing protein [Lewinella sp.]|nr:PAS domain-containing protein [Lewinella sp.]
MKELAALHLQYAHLLNSQRFQPEQLDYSLLDRHVQWLERMGEVEQSLFSIFDLHRRRHAYFSRHFNHTLGYDLSQLRGEDTEFFAKRIHPDDLHQLTVNSIHQFRFILQKPPTERKHYKLINDFRIRNARGKFVRVLEQHQALELDPAGNVWLSLSALNLSPNQDLNTPLQSTLFHTRSGRIIPLRDSNVTTEILSEREKQILALIRQGAASKTIADRLFISVHTVNTHRQRILRKLQVTNSVEAVQHAVRQGLI